MGFFSRKKKVQEKVEEKTLYKLQGVKTTHLLAQYDRWVELLPIVREKFYTKEEIDIMSNALSSAGKPIDMWNDFVWFDRTKPFKVISVGHVTYPKAPKYDSLLPENMEGQTKENLDKAFNELLEIGAIYGADHQGTISSEKILRNIKPDIFERFEIRWVNFEFYEYSLFCLETEDGIFHISVPSELSKEFLKA